MVASDLVNILFVNDNTPELLENSLRSIARKEHYISCEIRSEKVDTNGASCLGEIYSVHIKGETVNRKKETNYFVKETLRGDNIPSYINIDTAFEYEIIVYNDLSKIFDKLQEYFGVPLEERYKLVQSYEESNTDYIILDDMSKKGFDTYYRMDLVDLKFAKLSVQQLAKFHALSFAIETQMPEYFNSKIKKIKEPFSWEDGANKATECAIRITVDNVKDEYIKKKAEAFISVGLSKHVQYDDNSSTNILCLCHGDYKPTNILKKENNGEVIEVIPVDFQHLRYGCPIDDLVFFVFLGTDRAFRNQHLSNLKDLYYTTLANFSHYFNIDIEHKIPRQIFENTFKERLDYGLISAMKLFPNHFASACGESPNIELDDRFQDRFKDIIEEFVEWGYL